MSDRPDFSIALLDSYASASAIHRGAIDKLRALAKLDLEQAHAAEVVEKWFVAFQDLILADNTCFDLIFQFIEAFGPTGSGIGGLDNAAADELTGYLVNLVGEGESRLGELASFERDGRLVVGARRYRAQLEAAREILEDAAIRDDALGRMPGVESLDAIAEAHQRSIHG